MYLYIGERAQLLLQYLVGLEGLHEFENRHRSAGARQVDCGLDARIAAADHSDMLPGVERPVAVGAEGYAAADVLRFARHPEPAPRSSRGDDQCRGAENLPAFGMQLPDAAVHVETFDAAVVADVNPVGLHVSAQVARELCSGRARHRDQVFDAYRFIDLPADLFCHDRHAEPLAGCIDRGRSSGGAAPGDQQVVFAHDGRDACVRSTEALLEFVQQFGQRAAADVDQLFAVENRRHGLDIQPCNLLGEQGSVHGRMGDPGVGERQQVERLYHIGAVGAGERHVGRQRDLPAERPDLSARRFVGQVFALAVGVQHGQYQRAEFMAVGHRPEVDAGVLVVAQKPELQSLPVGDPTADLRGTGGRLFEQPEQLSARRMAGVGRDVEHVGGFQPLEQAEQLLPECMIQHGP